MNWGKSIVLIFILFAGFISTLVVLMSRQRVDLVRDDYYQNELVYQRQIERIARTQRLGKSVHLTYQPTRQQMAVLLPDSLQTGEVLFYRPSDRTLDFRVRLNANDQRIQIIPATDLKKGFWKAEFSWTDGQSEFFSFSEVSIQ
ncbi:FixH family protein [Larkinella rosea]|uniref:Nitrogen fixation protein FixH n=1 Tax=Larkinella rosea TaxID=2025312 RepID=A0A3P1C195_9BACT|nr:FixH family protein [Larkinella rosea]RRB06989.1 nitrogen fixation protein FixH [Larkinella rosea]